MKPIHNILLTLLLVASVFSTISYISCKKDQCNNVTCLNLGSCSNGVCNCPTGYEGARCDTLSRNKFIATYNGTDSCSPSSYNSAYHIGFHIVPAADLQMTMTNFLNNSDDSAICTMQATDSFSFSGSNNSTTYYGDGRLYHDTLKLYFSVKYDTFTYSCVYIGGK